MSKSMFEVTPSCHNIKYKQEMTITKDKETHTYAVSRLVGMVTPVIGTPFNVMDMVTFMEQHPRIKVIVKE